MENTHNQKVPSSPQKQLREDDVNIIKGARETDQLEGMNENAKKNPMPPQNDAGTSPDVEVNDGKDE